MQNLSLFAWSAGMLSSGNLWVFAGIAAVACVLGIEVASIWILIRKFLRAKRRSEALEEEESEQTYSQYAAVAFGMATVSFTAETLLLILSVLAAVAAAIFLILLVVFRAGGYDYISAELLREEKSRQENEVAYEPAELPEETRQASAEEIAAMKRTDEEAAVAVFSENSEEAELISAEASSFTEAFAEDEVATGKVLDAEEATPVAPANGDTGESTGMAPIGAVPAGANAPTRIVQIEKQYTETVKEIQNPAPAAQADSATDALIEKLNTLIDKMDKQQEAAGAFEHPAADTDADAPISTDLPDDEEDEEDEDENDTEDADGATDGKGEDDSDDEPDDPEHFTGNERIIGFDEATGCYIVAHYRKSFEAKLIQSRPNIKNYYSEIKNALLAYKGTKSRISWTADSFHNGRVAIAKINAKTRILELYLALDPASLEGTVYRGHDVSRMKKYTDTPFRYKIRTPRKLKWALELVQRVCEEHGLSPIDLERVDYEAQYPFEDTDSLVERGLIKEYIREENPASTFELDESHVTALPSEDETVIPANANFSWEFDNEMMAQKDPDPIPEPEPEPELEPEPEPIPDPAPTPEPTSAPTGTVIRETTKITQVRYTEQIYGDSESSTVYREYLTNDDPLTVGIPAFEAASAAQNESADQESTPTDSDAFATEQTVEEAEAETPEAEAGTVDVAEETDADEPFEEAEETEVFEEESGLLSAFEQTERPIAPEDDLDWGIPTGLSVSIEDEMEESVEDTTEEQIEEATEEPNEEESYEEAYEEVSEEDSAYGENGEAYVEENYAYDENGEAYAEEDYAYDENGEAYVEENYAYDENGEVYAEEDDAYDESEAYAEEPVHQQINPEVALVDVSVLEENFPNGAEIDLNALKASGLVLPTAKTLKISAASGELSKAFTVVADQFSMSAIIAIDAAGGDAQKIIQR